MTAARLTKAERSIPVVLAVAMFVLVALVLPTVLRPADPLTNQAAEFSPDAPPDNQESIVEALNRGTSATAGFGEGEGTNVGPGDLGPGEAEGAPPVQGPASRGRCFGNPPRQVRSVYAPPCKAAFVGDNGGATAAGVSATEFRVAVYVADYDDAEEGPVDETETYQAGTQRALLAMQNWFNKYFEFYGRQMRIFIVKQSLTSSSEGASAALRAKQQYDVFAAGDTLGTNPGTFGESMNQGIVTWNYQMTDAYLNGKSPYGWSFFQGLEETYDIGTEVVCKQLVGKPPQFNEQRDQTFNYGQPRKFGLFLFEDSIRKGAEQRIKAAVEKCGGSIEHTVKFAFEDEGASGAAAAMTQMRARGVTTVLDFADWFSAGLLTDEATRLDYWPEWVVGGVGFLDLGTLAQNNDPEQWAHALGISTLEIPRPIQYAEDVMAVREMDPSNNYSGGQAGAFVQLFAIAAGVQMAGPKLTPQTFEQGLFRLPHREPDPIWSQGGGYGPGNHTYVEYAMLVWWDKNQAHVSNGAPGTYRYMFGGKHYRKGQIPTEPLPWFKDGIHTPADPVIRDSDRTHPR